jgi:hypothetical protein
MKRLESKSPQNRKKEEEAYNKKNVHLEPTPMHGTKALENTHAQRSPPQKQ